MIKILGLALYGPLAASTRYRLAQYIPGLAAHGIDLQIRHLLDDNYLRGRFAGRPPHLASLLSSAAQRFSDLLGQRRFDACMLYGELLPMLPGFLESALLRCPYIYDFDDAFYLKYKQGKFGVFRTILGAKFDRVMRSAAAITAGNHELQSYALRHNTCAHYLPTVVDTKRYRPCPELRGSHPLTVGWIGSPSTAPYLSQLATPLALIARESPLRFVVIGGKAPNIPGVEVIEHGWSEAEEVRLINTFDIGVMPLPDDAWARGKCAFKLIQYMACGVPVIASAVGANKTVVTDGCGLLVSDIDGWVRALRTLRDDAQTRCAMGQAARLRVDQNFSLHRAVPVLASVLAAAAKETL